MPRYALTLESATEALQTVDRVKKKKGNGWAWENVEITERGQAKVWCSFNVGTPTLQRWFKAAGMAVIWIERKKEHWSIHFEPTWENE